MFCLHQLKKALLVTREITALTHLRVQSCFYVSDWHQFHIVSVKFMPIYYDECLHIEDNANLGYRLGW